MNDEVDTVAPGGNTPVANSRGAPVSRPARWLEQHGGFVLLAAGAGLIALAAVLADMPAVAPIFAIFGAGMMILGAFFSRIEGGVEATRDGVKTVVREIERFASDQSLAPDEFAKLIEEALDRYQPKARGRSDAIEAGRQVAREVLSDAEDSPMQREARVAAAFTKWLADDGWDVREPPPQAAHVDLLAYRANEILAVELKALVGPVTIPMVNQALAAKALVQEQEPDRRIRAALAFSGSATVTHAAARHAGSVGVEVYRVDGVGDVKRLL